MPSRTSYELIVGVLAAGIIGLLGYTDYHLQKQHANQPVIVETKTVVVTPTASPSATLAPTKGIVPFITKSVK